MDGSLRRSLHTPPTSAGRQSDVEPKMPLLHCKLDESVHMSKLGTVMVRSCEAVEASAKASATRRVRGTKRYADGSVVFEVIRECIRP